MGGQRDQRKQEEGRGGAKSSVGVRQGSEAMDGWMRWMGGRWAWAWDGTIYKREAQTLFCRGVGPSLVILYMMDGELQSGRYMLQHSRR